MKRVLRPWPLGLATVLLLALLPLTGCDSDDPDPQGASAEVKVMTYNLYLGAEIFDLVGVSADSIAFVAGDLFEDVRDTDFPARAEAIADIIEAENPALIGLQEVTRYRSGPGNDPQPATEDEFDFLQILLDALDVNGLDYRVVATTTNADVEVPAVLPEGLRDIRLTDRDVILARFDVQATDAVNANFPTAAPIPIAGEIVPFTRGYNAVQATVEGVSFTFANAHLEVDDGNPQGAAAVQLLQAYELYTALEGVPQPVVLVGDFNSAADGSGTEITVTDPLPFTGTTYDLLTNFYTDAAAEVGATGDTCCQDADLLNTSSELDQRIDLILYRGDVEAVSAEVVGNERVDLGGPQWPSDHAGVVATLRIEN